MSIVAKWWPISATAELLSSFLDVLQLNPSHTEEIVNWFEKIKKELLNW